MTHSCLMASKSGEMPQRSLTEALPLVMGSRMNSTILVLPPQAPRCSAVRLSSEQEGGSGPCIRLMRWRVSQWRGGKSLLVVVAGVDVDACRPSRWEGESKRASRRDPGSQP